MPIPLIVAEFESADEIHKIWNDDSFILYNQIKRLLLRANLELTFEQKMSCFNNPSLCNYQKQGL